MHSNDSSPAARKSRQRTLSAAVAGVSMLLAGWPAAFAASAPGISCGQGSRQPQELPAVDLVDLSDVDDASRPQAVDSAAPLLYLAPRVVSILEDVFRDGQPEKSVSASADAADGGDPGPENAATSPVAGHLDSSDTPEAEASRYEDAAILPRFQRRMYRTDI